MRRLALLLLAGSLLLAACSDDPTAPPATGTTTPAAFPADVQPLLAGLPEHLVALLARVRAAGPGTLVWSDTGGEYHEGQRLAYLADWERITGWTVQPAPHGAGASPQDFEVKVGSGNTEWDVVVSSGPADAMRWQEEGLLEPLDLSYFPIERMPASSPHTDYWIDYQDGDTPLVYNTERFPDPATAPSTVLDLFDTPRFPGKRCVWAAAPNQAIGSLEYALLADGVAPSDLYAVLATDEGRARAYAKLDTIRDDIVFVDSGANSIQFVLDGQCDLGLTWNGRPALRLKQEPDLPIAVVHRDAGSWASAVVIPKGAPNPEAALSALALAMTDTAQCRLLDSLAYGVVLEGMTCLSDFARQYGPDPAATAFTFAGEAGLLFYREHAKDLVDEWEAWKAGP